MWKGLFSSSVGKQCREEHLEVIRIDPATRVTNDDQEHDERSKMLESPLVCERAATAHDIPDLGTAVLPSVMRHMRDFSVRSMLAMSLTCRDMDHMIRTDDLLWRRDADTEQHLPGCSAYRSYQFFQQLKAVEGQFIINKYATRTTEECPNFLPVKLLDIEFHVPAAVHVSLWTADAGQQVVQRRDPAFKITPRPVQTQKGLFDLHDIDERYWRNWRKILRETEMKLYICVVLFGVIVTSVVQYLTIYVAQRQKREDLRQCLMMLDQDSEDLELLTSTRDLLTSTRENAQQRLLCSNLESSLKIPALDYCIPWIVIILLSVIYSLPVVRLIWLRYIKNGRWTLQEWLDGKCHLVQALLRQDSFISTMAQAISKGYLIPLRTVCPNALDSQYLMKKDGSWPQSLPRPGLYTCSRCQVTVGYSAHTMHVARLLRQRTDFLKEDLCVQVASAMVMTGPEQLQLNRDQYMSFEKGLGGNPNQLTQPRQVHLPTGDNHNIIGDCRAWYSPSPPLPSDSNRLRWKLLVKDEDHFDLVMEDSITSFDRRTDIL